MSKRDVLMQGVANVRESMGDFGDSVRGAPTPGPRALPDHLRGVVRTRDVSLIELDRIVRDPDQPREEFEAESLQRLAASLKSRGQLQPIRVRWSAEQGVYVIVCGERRWRAAQMAGLANLSCVIVAEPLSPDELLAVQLVENAVREDLRPIEQAIAYQRLMTAKGWSARQLAGELAIHHAQVVRALSLLVLPDSVRQLVEQGGLAPATAYEISKIKTPATQAVLAERAVAEGMNREAVIEAVKAVRAERPVPTPKPEPVTLDLGDGISVTIRWRKPSEVSALQAALQAVELLQQTPVSGEQGRGEANA